MYYRKHKTGRMPLKRKIPIIIAVILTLLLILDSQIRPMIDIMIKNQAKLIFTQSVNLSIDEIFDECEISFEDLADITYGENGNVSSVQSNSVELARLSNMISMRVQQKLIDMESRDIGIPLGTVTGINILTGRGPEIPLRLQLNGNVITQMESKLSNGGINQTMYTVSCLITSDVYVVIPGFSASVKLSGSIPLLETVIVGEVPDSYTYVYGDQSDTIGRIFDYGDPYGQG